MDKLFAYPTNCVTHIRKEIMNTYQQNHTLWPKFWRNLSHIDLDDLPRYLAKIEQIFDIEQIVNQAFSSTNVVDYYEQSAFGYNLFHSQGSIPMALNADGKFNTDGYYGQARIIQNTSRPHIPGRF